MLESHRTPYPGLRLFHTRCTVRRMNLLLPTFAFTYRYWRTVAAEVVFSSH